MPPVHARSRLLLRVGALALAALLPSTIAAQDGGAKTASAAKSGGKAKKPAAAPAKKKPARAPGEGPPGSGHIPDSTEAAKYWPVKSAPAPAAGAVIPAKRIVAYYGNPLSKRMGVLGEYAPEEMLSRLEAAAAEWRRADPSTPVQPALHLIAVVAQGAPGRDGKYRLRMDSTLIEKVYGWAHAKGMLLFVDVQVGQSSLQAELPLLERFLKRPDVHLGVDPEFSMHYASEGRKPGSKIGTFRAEDVNYASGFLQGIVSKYKLPPKVLVVHRFTKNMLPNAEEISLDPRVQVVIDMDGWGPKWLKLDSYHDYVYKHPVQFTGFKLFYHNDTKKPGSKLMTPAEVLALRPKPLYIQYQ